jgi:hypothetical protein
MEAASTSETLVPMYKTGRCHFQEDGHVQKWGFSGTELFDYVMELLFEFLFVGVSQPVCRDISLQRRFGWNAFQQESRDSSVGIAAGWTAGLQFPAGARDFSLLHSV